MFIAQKIFDRLTGVYDERVSDLRSAVEVHLQAVLASQAVAHQAVVASKEEKVALLQLQISELKTAVAHERARAEAAIDRLLARDAGVFPVGPQPAAAAAASPADSAFNARMKAVEDIFAKVNGVGEDIQDEDPTEITHISGTEGTNAAANA